MTEAPGEEKSPRKHSDPLTKMPPLLRKWAEKKGLDRLLARYGWSTCKVCGRIGIPWYTPKLPAGINLEFESPRTGWLHPPGEGTESGYGFRELWKSAQEVSEKTGQSIDQVVAGLEQTLFDGFMRSVANTAWMGHTPEQMMRGSTNLFDFCIYPKMVLWARQGRKHGACPKCGEPGTGEGKVGNERRFFHEPNRSCYVGMVNPVRKQGVEVKCPKCGELGRESVSKGYKYIRHKNKTCYVGKLSGELP